MARCVFVGSFPACQAMTASTANSGSVCSHARIANARPCDIRNCAASAAQAMMKDEKRMLGKVQSAERGELPFGIIDARFYDEDDFQPSQRAVQARARRRARACRGDRHG